MTTSEAKIRSAECEVCHKVRPVSKCPGCPDDQGEMVCGECLRASDEAAKAFDEWYTDFLAAQ